MHQRASQRSGRPLLVATRRERASWAGRRRCPASPDASQGYAVRLACRPSWPFRVVPRSVNRPYASYPLPDPLGEPHVRTGRVASRHRVIWLDADGRLLRANATVAAWSGEPENLQALLPLLDDARWAAWRARGFADVLQLGLRQRSGALMLVHAQLDPAADGGHLLSLWSSLQTGERAAIDALQRSVLRAVATAQPLAAVMELLCREVENLAPEVICSVLRVDAEGRVHPLAGPSLPAAYTAALEGAPIGPQAGSCGTAAWRREAVEVSSIATDPLWAHYKDLALGHGLAACWSTPILLDDGARVAATFALYYRQERAIADYHRHLVNACTQLVRVALLHHEHESRIERLAYFDGITGLPNRLLFQQRAESQLRRLADAGETGALLLMDLDRFKTVNEVQGHAVGNEVLRRVAQAAGRVPARPGHLGAARRRRVRGAAAARRPRAGGTHGRRPVRRPGRAAAAEPRPAAPARRQHWLERLPAGRHGARAIAQAGRHRAQPRQGRRPPMRARLQRRHGHRARREGLDGGRAAPGPARAPLAAALPAQGLPGQRGAARRRGAAALAAGRARLQLRRTASFRSPKRSA